MTRISSSRLFALMVMLAGQPALAQDDNLVFVDQDGRLNSGDINQTGANNQLGTDGDPALQTGFYNLLELDQIGTDNRVGTEGTGLDQMGDAATPLVFNRITIRQQSDGNTVGEVRQSALGTIPDGANRLNVLQSGGNLNRIGTVLQLQSDEKPGQSATVIQTGQGNVVARIEQQSLTPADNGENSIRAEFIGDGNGAIALSGWALNSDAPSGELVQTSGDDGLGANGNDIDLFVRGNFNRFGIFQGGQLNSVGQITIEGDGNQLGVRQDGFQNDFTSSVISGNGNDIGFEQWGTNTAYLDVLGQSNDNRISSFQDGANDARILVDGHRNLVLARQEFISGRGVNNDADVVVTGSDNSLDLRQQGSNSAMVVIAGDMNNAVDFRTPSPGLLVGVIEQTGLSNDLSASIDGDENLFAVRQTGDSNLARILVIGTMNEAELLQSGGNNTAGLSQQGVGNRAVISQ